MSSTKGNAKHKQSDLVSKSHDDDDDEADKTKKGHDAGGETDGETEARNGDDSDWASKDDSGFSEICDASALSDSSDSTDVDESDGEWFPGDSESGLSVTTHDGSSYGDEGFIKADRIFYHKDKEIDAWLAAHLGGLPKLYPHLFVVQPRNGAIITQPMAANKRSPLLSLPQNLRDQIMLYCVLDDCLGNKAWSWSHYCSDIEYRKQFVLEIDSTNESLKEMLINPLFRVSRQIRHEGMTAIFRNTEFSTSWLPSITRFAQFLGDPGRALMRSLTIWDHCDMKACNTEAYLACIDELRLFQHLDSLYIILTGYSVGQAIKIMRHVSTICFDTEHQDLTKPFRPKSNAVPKMRFDDLSEHWPEYEALKKLSARDFNLGLQMDHDTFVFDHCSEALRELYMTMQANADLAERSRRTVIEDIERAPTSNAHMTLPLYNFLRKLWNGTSTTEDLHICFPYANASEGEKVDGCAFCHFSGKHCGYHIVPTLFQDEENRESFDEMLYKEMKQAVRDVIAAVQQGPQRELLSKAVASLRYFGWPSGENDARFDEIDKLIDGGYTGKEGDKEGFTIWDTTARVLQSMCSVEDKGHEELQI